MLKVLRPKYEKFHGVTISDATIEAAVKLSKKYVGERYLPDKAVDLLDEASAWVKLGRSEAHLPRIGSASAGHENLVTVINTGTVPPPPTATETQPAGATESMAPGALPKSAKIGGGQA